MGRSHTVAKRIAIGLAALGMVLCLGGTVAAVRTVITNAGHLSALNLWSALPLSLAAVSLPWIIQSGAPWTVWVAVGALWGFVIAAAWSLGLFYVHGALAFLAAAVTDLVSRRSWWTIPLALVWFVTGLSALGPFFLVVGWVREGLDPRLTVGHAEAEVFAVRLFLGAVGVLLSVALIRFLRPHC